MKLLPKQNPDAKPSQKDPPNGDARQPKHNGAEKATDPFKGARDRIRLLFDLLVVHLNQKSNHTEYMS